MSHLLVLASFAQGLRCTLDSRRELLVGRDVCCDLVVPKQSISRKHARVFHDGSDFCIEDLASANGTFVNGRRVEGATPLRDGDHISLHDIPLLFSLNDEDAETFAKASEPPRPPVPEHAAPELTLLQGRLHNLVDISRRLGSSLEADDILPRVLELLFEMYPQTVAGEIQLADAEGQLAPAVWKRGRGEESALGTHVPLDDPLARQVLASGQAMLSTSQGDPGDSVFDDTGSSILCVPMGSPAHAMRGTILLETDDLSRAFTSDDLHLVETVGVLASQALEYARTHRVVVKWGERQKQIEFAQQMMEVAKQIQTRMLPRTMPEAAGYALAKFYEPADAVGGDYYFWDRLPDQRIVLGVADASGKSLPGALVVAQLAAEIRHCIGNAPTLKTAMTQLNRFVCDLEAGFITMCLCVLDIKEHSLTVVNAGHPFPLRRQEGSGAIDQLAVDRHSMPMGVMRDEMFHPTKIALQPGDTVILYTDGVIEAMTARNELYGRRRLEAVVSATADGPDTLLAEVVADIRRFRGDCPASDDICLLAFSRLDATP